MDFEDSNFRKDIERQDETQAVTLSNFVFIGAVEIYTREGETDCEEIPNSGKQRMRRIPVFHLVPSSSPSPALTPLRPRAAPDPSPQHTIAAVKLTRKVSPPPFSPPSLDSSASQTGQY